MIVALAVFAAGVFRLVPPATKIAGGTGANTWLYRNTTLGCYFLAAAGWNVKGAANPPCRYVPANSVCSAFNVPMYELPTALMSRFMPELP